MKLSIIIPIYNSANYLDKCLNSLQKQIGSTEEIILINDGSTDNSLEICKTFKNKISTNVILINKKNEGIALSRNLGLKLATGDYILWIDSDDWITDNYIKSIKTIINKTKADIILFDYYTVNREKLKKRSYIFKDKRNCFIKKEEIMREIAQDSFFSYFWRSVIKRDLYKGLSYPKNVQIMEDFAIYHLIFDKAKTYFYLTKPLYCYREIANSLSRKTYDMLLTYHIAIQREQFFKKKYPNIKEKYRMVPVIRRRCYVSELELNEIDNGIYGNIKKLILKNYIFLMTRKYIGKKEKINMTLMMISMNLLRIIKKCYKKIFDK